MTEIESLKEEVDRYQQIALDVMRERDAARALVREAYGYLRNGSGYREQIANWLGRARDLELSSKRG